jgi:hypothetical protein
MADILWRPVLGGLSAVLARAGSESTMLLLLRGYQSYTYSAGGGGGGVRLHVTVLPLFVSPGDAEPRHNTQTQRPFV